MSILRDYQRNGIDAILKSWNNGKRPMVSIATGGGKTTIMAHLIEMIPLQRVLVIAHTEEIVQQIFDTIKRKNISTGIVMGPSNNLHERVIVASRQSLPNRLKKIDKFGHFGTVIIDEAHHASKENTYGRIFQILEDKKPNLVGFTATPTPKNQSLFDEIAFTWTIQDGIKSGFLVPTQIINFEPKDNWPTKALKFYKDHILPSDRPCLAFFPSLATSKQFTRLLKRNKIRAAHLDGKTPKEKRDSTLRKYKSGSIRIICNMQILTEGFDAPNTSAILLIRPTKSKSLLTQIIGRGLRTAPNKSNCLVVNMGDNTLLNEILP
jgi:superfamily II DNA or RNA helicase